jgi:hypothetical protein
MRALIVVTIAAFPLAGCQSHDGEPVDAKDSKLISEENRVLDPGGAMSDPNARILIGGNEAGPAPEGPRPEPLNHAIEKKPRKTDAHPREGH